MFQRSALEYLSSTPLRASQESLSDYSKELPASGDLRWVLPLPPRPGNALDMGEAFDVMQTLVKADLYQLPNFGTLASVNNDGSYLNFVYERPKGLLDHLHFWGADNVDISGNVPVVGPAGVRMEIPQMKQDGRVKSFGFLIRRFTGMHTAELRNPEDASKTRFQLSLLNEGQEPVVIQAASARLILDQVAAFEAVKAVPLSALPYPSQGVVLDTDGKVTTLFKESPLGKTRLSFRDRLWSLDEDRDQALPAKDLSAQLEQLGPGKHYVYYITAKALEQRKESLDLAQKNGDRNPPMPLRERGEIVIP